MGRRGPAKTPTPLAIVKGERTHRINHHEPQPDNDLPIEVPDGIDLGTYGQWEWNRLIGDLKAKDVVTAWDIQTLAAWCEQVNIHWTSADLITREGLMLEETVYSRGEPIGERYKVHPAWKAHQDSLNNMMRISARFGFTPADRAAIAVKPTENTKPGEDLLTG
jgi:P27 family predicted phage terminase small subunit